MQELKVIITGATGMVGEGVLHECLSNPDVKKILLINRKPSGVGLPKVDEIIHQDFQDISPIADELQGYNACFFCVGISSVGVPEKEYFAKTYTLTMEFAKSFSRINPDSTFCYISGAGTDSSEKGRIRWARVKGKTENDLMKLPFKAIYNFRPAYLHPTKGLQNTSKYYHYISFLYPVLKRLMPGYVSTLQDLGTAMINAASKGYDKSVLEVTDINAVAKR